MYQKYACRRCCSEPLRKVKIVSQIINQLGNDRIGVAYAGSAFPVLPITTDYSVAKMFLQSMNTEMVSQGTSRSGDKAVFPILMIRAKRVSY
jgi:hypothetical protein